MRSFIIVILIIPLAATSVFAEYDLGNLARAINETYPVCKVNGKATKEKLGFELIFNVSNPEQVEIPNFNEVLNGQSHILLSSYGRIIPKGQYGYIVGTAVEGPTFGKLILFDNEFRKLAFIESQKVVKIMLINLLGDNTQQIVTWEDHHYGTNTTRRVLNIYKIDHNRKIKKLFNHDLIDATFMPPGTDHEIKYTIDYQSLIKQKQIIVINQDTGAKQICSWDGDLYKGEDCQEEYPN